MIRYFNGYILYPILEKGTKRDIFSKQKELKKFERLKREKQLITQRNEFYKILQFCKNNVPYYQDLFKAQSFSIEKVKRDIKYLEDLPVLTKDIVRNNLDRIKMPNAHHARKTGGSTGQSVHFFYDSTGLDWTSAINLQAYEMAGNYLHKKDMHISSELGIEPPNLLAKIKDRVKLFSQNRARLMISSFSEDDLETTYKSLNKKKPYLLQGHPSSAYAIAEYIERNNKRVKTYCNIFEPSGEMLTPKMVKSIEKNLGAKVVNRYGNAEFGVMSHSKLTDNYSKMKIFERAFHIEECNQDTLIVSNCTNFGMPLIRYNTGDLGTVKTEEDGSYIYDIMGRVHDNVTINNKVYATHYIMDYLDHKIRNIREFQILVDETSTPQINIVAEKENDKERIESEFLKRWPEGINVNFISYNELIKSGWRQKFRHVVNRHSIS